MLNEFMEWATYNLNMQWTMFGNTMWTSSELWTLALCILILFRNHYVPVQDKLTAIPLLIVWGQLLKSFSDVAHRFYWVLENFLITVGVFTPQSNWMWENRHYLTYIVAIGVIGTSLYLQAYVARNAKPNWRWIARFYAFVLICSGIAWLLPAMFGGPDMRVQ